MIRLRIIASGKTPSDKNQARGKLFEELSSRILSHYGYKVNTYHPSINHAGMEIDIEGKHAISHRNVYAECKCYSSDIDSPKLQAFLGKFTAFWIKNENIDGIFLAIPGLNSNALGFYKENLESEKKMKIILLQEPDVVKLLLDSKMVISEDELNGKITYKNILPGDSILVYSDKGLFWIKYLIYANVGIANAYLVFDGKGNIITELTTIKYISDSLPELESFDFFHNENKIGNYGDLESDNIVELRGSSTCFEYQFPASPEFFIGRQDAISKFDSFFASLREQKTSLRGLLLEGNSGWGKSSLALTLVDKIKNSGHYALAIDSRSASSSKFFLSLVNYIFHALNDIKELNLSPCTITGYQGALNSLLILGEELQKNNKYLFVFLDQFENIFHQTIILDNLQSALLKVTDRKTNIIFVFSWKTDLLGMTNDFPYKQRDSIIHYSMVLHLSLFSTTEIDILLNKLSKEMHTTLRKDLRFMLSEFSQGYPWLLKNCVHM